MSPLPARTRLAAGLGAAVSGVSRLLGTGGGSVIGGRAILAVDPGALGRLAAGPERAAAALEVDEAWLARVVEATSPAAVALLNLSRDQLDRNNEVRSVAGRWRAALAGASATVVANADDPLVVWGAGAAGRVRWVGAGQP